MKETYPMVMADHHESVTDVSDAADDVLLAHITRAEKAWLDLRAATDDLRASARTAGLAWLTDGLDEVLAHSVSFASMRSDVRRAFDINPAPAGEGDPK